MSLYSNGINPEHLYVDLPACVDQYGHRFKADMIRAETAVCEKCGLIRKKVVRR